MFPMTRRQQEMWSLNSLFSLEELEMAFPQISVIQLLNVIPHLRANYIIRRNETLALTESFVSKLTIIEKTNLMDVLVKYDQWPEFNYIIYKCLIKQNKDTKHRSEEFQRHFVKRVVIGLKSKELIKVTLELFITYVEIHPIKYSDVVEAINEAVEQEIANSILINNITTRFIPCGKKIWGKDFLDLLSNVMGEKNKAIHLSVLKNLMDIKDSDVRYETFVKFMNIKDPNCRQLIFQILCRIKKTNYFYNIYDFEFLFHYIQNGDPSVIIDNLPYFCSHIYYCGNTRERKLGRVCERVIHILRKIALLLLSGRKGLEQIEVGGFLYHILSEMLIKNRTKTAYSYTADYLERGSPLCISLFSKNQLHLGSGRDINTLVKRLLNMDSLIPIIKILRDIPETSVLVKQEFFLSFLMTNFTDPNHLFIEEKIDIFIEFLVDVYNKTYKEKLIFFTNWLQLWKDYSEKQEQLHLNVYFSLRAILAAIKQYKLPFQEDYIKLNDVHVQIDALIQKHNENANPEDIRLAEIMLTGSAELLIDVGQRRIDEGIKTIRKILNKLESIINCNKRYVTTAVTSLYKKFVANVSPLYIEFFREYLFEKISLINPEITKQSKLRRGAEHRAVIHSICAEVPNCYKEGVIATAITQLLVVVRNNNLPAETIATAIHCINQIMEDKALKKYSSNQIFDLLNFCLTFTNNVNFTLSNARYLLFRTLTTRILPSVDRRNNLQLNDVFRMYPKLYETVINMMGNSDTFNQDTKILLICFLKSASENNLFPSLSDYHFNIFPIFGKMLNKRFDRTVYLVLELFVSIIPVHDISECFLIIVSFLLNSECDTSLQAFYNHLYILNILSEKLLLHIEDDFCQRSIKKWQRMQKSLQSLKNHKKFELILKTGLICNLDNEISLLQNVTIIMNYDNIPKCLAVLNFITENKKISDSAKVMAADTLLKRVDKKHYCYVDIISTSVIIALTVEPVSQAQNLIIQLIYILSSCELVFSPQIVRLMLMPYEDVLDKTNQCTKYIFLYTYILSYIPEITVSVNIKRLILNSFYLVEDDEAATVFHRLSSIIKNRTDILLLGLFIVTLSDYEDRFICQSVFNHLNIIVDSFEAGIETMLSMLFLKDYLKCPKAVQTFMLRTTIMFVDIDKKNVLLKRQFECVYKNYKKLLLSFVS